MIESAMHTAKPWPERPVSAANKSGNDTAARRGIGMDLRGF